MNKLVPLQAQIETVSGQLARGLEQLGDLYKQRTMRPISKDDIDVVGPQIDEVRFTMERLQLQMNEIQRQQDAARAQRNFRLNLWITLAAALLAALIGAVPGVLALMRTP